MIIQPGSMMSRRSAGAAASTLNNGLIARWSMDEESGTRADSVGTADWADINTVGFTTGILGNAARFIDGNGEALAINDADWPVDPNGAWTYLTWVALQFDPTPGGPQLNASVLTKRVASDDWSFQLLYLESGAGNDQFRLSVFRPSDTTTFVDASTFGTPAQDTFVALLAYHDPDNDLIGIGVNGGTIDTTAHSTGLFDSTAQVQIGNRQSDNNVDSSIDTDESALYDRVITPAEFAEWYNEGNGVTYPY